MAIRGSDFGETVLAVRADDSELRATLAKDEAFVRTSTAKMQGSLNSLNVPMKSLGVSNITVGGTFAVLGSAVSVFGGTAGAVVGPVIALSGALAALGATVAVLAVPFALLGAILARHQIADFLEGLGEAEAVAKRLEADVLAADKRRAARIKAAADAEVAATKALRDKERAAADIVSGRIGALQREVLILEGRKTATDFITNAMERQLTVQRNQLQIQKEQLASVEREKQARRDLITAQGPQTRGEASQAISQALTLFNAQQNAIFQMRTLARDLLETGRLTQDQFREINRRFGLGAVGSAAERADLADRTGGLAIPATRFTDIAAFGRGAGDPAARRDEERNRKLDTIIRQQRQGGKLGP